MKCSNYIKGLFSIIIILNSLYVIQADAFPGTNSSKTLLNINQGNITLFSQNYSEIDNVPDNVFIAKFTNSTNSKFDLLYSIVYGTHNSKVVFNNTSHMFTYTTTRESSPSLSSLFPALESIFDFVLSKYREYYWKYSEKYNFCKSASIPLSRCYRQPNQIGSLYISHLVPMVKSTYQISMDMKTDSPDSFIEIISPGSKLIIQEIDNNTVLKSYYKNSAGNMNYKIISIGNATEISKFDIIFDGYNKTNTIYIYNDNYIITPFYNVDRQNLPYVDFSGGNIKITNHIIGKGTYLDVNIFQITQIANRKLITAIGSKNMEAFGIDGPHPRNTVEKGINFLESKGGKGTIWFTPRTIGGYDEKYVEYIRNLIINNSWDLGIHYSKELNKLPLEQAYKIMNEEYSDVYTKIGRAPTTWCSLRNDDNVTHAIYAYDHFGMIWRNGDAGVHAETDGGVGNIDDYNWVWWKSVSKAGMIYPVFTHRTDENPSIRYSISFPKFQTWVNNYDSNNISIVSFYEYWQTNSNTYYAYFDNIEYDLNTIAFNAKTNGANALINVNITAKNDSRIYDNTSKRFIDNDVENDKSMTFWVKNGHNYIIYIVNAGQIP